MADGNVSDFNAERFRRGLDPVMIAQASDSVETGGSNGGPPDMSESRGRLSKLEGALDALKVVRPMTLTVFGLVLTVMVFGFAFLGTQMVSLSTQVGRLSDKIDSNYGRLNDKIDANSARANEKLDAIPQRLAEEFRAMRAEMSAQTTAIAGSITAARQMPPQVLLVPAPAVEPPAQKP